MQRCNVYNNKEDRNCRPREQVTNKKGRTETEERFDDKQAVKLSSRWKEPEPSQERFVSQKMSNDRIPVD